MQAAIPAIGRRNTVVTRDGAAASTNKQYNVMIDGRRERNGVQDVRWFDFELKGTGFALLVQTKELLSNAVLKPFDERYRRVPGVLCFMLLGKQGYVMSIGALPLT